MHWLERIAAARLRGGCLICEDRHGGAAITNDDFDAVERVYFALEDLALCLKGDAL